MKKYAGEILSLKTQLLEHAITTIKNNQQFLTEQLPQELADEAKLVAGGEIWEGGGALEFVQSIFEIDLVELYQYSEACQEIISFLEDAREKVLEKDKKLQTTAADLRQLYSDINI